MKKGVLAMSSAMLAVCCKQRSHRQLLRLLDEKLIELRPRSVVSSISIPSTTAGSALESIEPALEKWMSHFLYRLIVICPFACVP